MAGMGGREARNFHVVTHQVVVRGKLVILAFEVLFLVVPAGPPGEDAGHVQVFAKCLPPHVPGTNPLLRALIVTATGGMDMMVQAVPAQVGHMHPALELKGGLVLGGGSGNVQLSVLQQVLRSTGVLDLIVSGREIDGFSVGPIDLRMKKEIWIGS